MKILATLAAGAIALAFSVGAAKAAEPLTVCLAEGNPPYSYKFGKRQGGFDLVLAEALAGKLGRELRVQWFETEQDEEDEVVPWQLNALLSDRRCHLLSGFAMIAGALTKPDVAEYKLPDYDGMTKADRKRRVKLRQIAVTEPYIRGELAVVLAPGAADVERLEDLKDRPVAAEVTTLAAAILYAYKHGFLADNVSTIEPNSDILPRVAGGEFEAALIELHKAERYNKRHPDAKVRVGGYRHPIGLNFGYAVLASSPTLIEEVNQALKALHEEGKIREIAAGEGLSYVAPKMPRLLRRITPSMLIDG